MNVAADVHDRRNCAYRGWLAIVGQIVGRRLEARTLARNTKHLASGILSNDRFSARVRDNDGERREGGIPRA